MTTGEGLFWVGFFYFLVNLMSYGYALYREGVGNWQKKRIDKIEEVLRESGVIE